MNHRNTCNMCKPNITDYGPEPFVADISMATKQNCNFRTAFWTGNHLQTTLMCIPVGGEIGLECHPDNDQFLRVEEGRGLIEMGSSSEGCDYQANVCEGYAVFVPAGTWHNLINTGNRPLKLYSIYAPPHHPHGTVHETKEIAEASEHRNM